MDERPMVSMGRAIRRCNWRRKGGPVLQVNSFHVLTFPKALLTEARNRNNLGVAPLKLKAAKPAVSKAKRSMVIGADE